MKNQITIFILLSLAGILLSFRLLNPPPPSNDACSSATVINITGGGYDYGAYTSSTSDMTQATAQVGEFFQFAPNHIKSVWFTFSIPTRRSARIEMAVSAGSVINNPGDAGVTVYLSPTCVPGSTSKLGAFISSGDVTNPCLEPGTYLIQVTGSAAMNATIYLKVDLNCPDHPIDSKFDCPAGAYVFNGGLPIGASAASDPHNIECQSIEDPSEYNCLPLANKTLYVKSTWYVFTTGANVDLMDFSFPMTASTDVAGYRLLEGNVRNSVPSTLTQIDCGVTKARFTTRFIEFPCILKPNTTYSLDIVFHRDFSYSDIIINVRQRSETNSGWSLPILPPDSPSNQLGTLAATPAPGLVTTWTDRFNCNSFIIDNVCPPANPATGKITAGTGTFDMTTWATFTLHDDSNVDFRFIAYEPGGAFYTRVFQKTLGNACPSPNPLGDLYLEFPSISHLEKCMPAGDYSIQILSSSAYAFSPHSYYDNVWSNGTLGTPFTLAFTVVSLPDVGLFRLDTPGQLDSINDLNPLQNNITYNATPTVFICENTVLPAVDPCANREKAIYREINIGDADGDGIADDGLLCMTNLRVDLKAAPPIHYSFLQGDANQLATAAGTHSAGEVIPGLIDYAGFCIDQDDDTLTLNGLPNFCACVTAGIYTLASYGDVDNVSKGDAPLFKFNVYNTLHDSRPKAEEIILGPVPGVYSSNSDYFSCKDNPDTLPNCNNAQKWIYREFYLPQPTVTIISETGTATNTLSLFTGRASDLAASLALHTDCFTNTLLYDYCTPLEAGWYTVISYGNGPNYTNNKVQGKIGYPGDVGKTTRISIRLLPVITPNYNLSNRAYQAGITDWFTPPPAFPNALTRVIYQFPNDTFCEPDFPFIPDTVAPCAPGYNRISMYVFEITKPSFVQILNLAQSYYTAVYPFDIHTSPLSMLTVPPVYPCVSIRRDIRQICDLPPGKYTIAIFANDTHKGLAISPAIYVDEAAESRFDHAWRAYDFDLVPTTNTFINGKLLDTHPTLPGQAPSRDVFYCTTGATNIDPDETKCDAQLNDLVYAQPAGVPKPLFLQNDPAPPALQPWRNLWYTFKLSGSGICTLRTEVLMGPAFKPLIALYESSEDGTIPWSTLQTTLMDPANTVIPGLKLIRSHVTPGCDSYNFDLVFTKSGCIRDNVRYYVVVSFDTQVNVITNFPNQAISVSLKYDPRPTFSMAYDERITANVINGLTETGPTYTDIKITPGDSFTGIDFSLLCYTKNVTDPPGCDAAKTGKSAWFKFEASATGHFYGALQEIGIPNGWFANVQDLTLWKETSPGGPLVQITMDSINTAGHEWIDGCIDRGVYYLLVRHCLRIDTIQPYSAVIKLEDSPGDFCRNAIQINVVNNNPVTGSTLIDCHTIGTDVGELLPDGNSCFSIPGRKTTWFHAIVNAGPMVDLNFELGENFQGSAVNLSDLSYRILSGRCGAMTPIVCSASGTNVITLNCLAPGEYYVQVSMPEKTGASNNSPELKGLLMLTITATPSDPVTCTSPFDPNQVLADFAINTGCDSVSFQNLSTSGTDISYLWQFPNGTSTDANPVWTPPGPGTYTITLTVTNVMLNTSAIKTLTVDITNPFINFVPLADDILCNHSGSVLLDATVAGATYEWNNGSVLSTRIATVPGTYWVIIRKDGCEKRDTVVVTGVDAIRMITSKICPEDSIVVHGQVFGKSNPSGLVTVPNADPSGCDSLLNVNVQFYPAANTLLTESICFGDSYAFANQNLTQSGTYTNMLTGINGCDSLITLDLTVKSLVIADNVVTSCAGASVTLQAGDIGASYLWNNGSTSDSIIVNVDGTYVVSISDIDNCVFEESVFDVTFGQLAVPAYSAPAFLCPGSDILLTATGSSGSYQWFDDAGGQNLLATGSTFLYPNVTHDDTLYVMAFDPSIAHCESNLVPVPLALEDEPAHAIEDEIICAGNTLLLPWGESVTPTTDDSYLHAWQNSVSGCDSFDLTVNVALIHLPPVDLPSSFTLQYGDSVLLVPQIDFIVDSLRWTPAAGLSCTDCAQTWASPEESIEYTLTIWSADGCVTTAVINIEVRRDVNIYIPNVFTPDGDGINDIFTVFGNREVKEVRKLMIYDRWGDAVWQGGGFPADGTYGWDGLFRGKKMQPGVMAWVCVVELANGELKTFAGDVTLVR